MSKSSNNKRTDKSNTATNSATVPARDFNDCANSVASNSSEKNKNKSPKSK